MSVCTYVNDLDLASKVNNYLDKAGITMTNFSKKINYSRTAVSQYLAGKYDANPIELEMAIEKFLEENQTETNEVMKTIDTRFFVTNDVNNMMAVCQSCQENLGLGIIVGKSGYGKTHTLKEYSKLNRVAYVECDDSMGARDLVEAIEISVGIPTGYGSIWKRVKGVKEFFNINRGYLLIIDEADKLITKYTQKKMEILRTIFDQSDVGLLIAGEPKLESMIKGYINRFANRVDFFITLKGLSRQEALNYLSIYNLSAKAKEELVIRAINANTGCFRLLNRTLKNVLRLVKKDQEIDLKTIEKASKMMML